MKRAIFLVLLLPVAAGCVRSEGPGERIGRGVDEIIEGTRDMDDRVTDDRVTGREDQAQSSQDSRHNLDSDEWWREHDRLMQENGDRSTP